MPFQTRNLNEAALIDAQGHPPTRTAGTGAAVTFEFDVDEAWASALIASDAYRAAAAFRRSWVRIRRLIEAANGTDNGHVPR